MLPDPAAVHAAPPVVTQVQSQLRTAGKGSVTVAPVTSIGPKLVAVTM
jgi:hypothetical protein